MLKGTLIFTTGAAIGAAAGVIAGFVGASVTLIVAVEEIKKERSDNALRGLATLATLQSQKASSEGTSTDASSSI